MKPRMCLSVKHTFTNGKSAKDEAQWFPSALPLWELHLCESCECSEPWLEKQTSTKLGPQDTIRKFLKHKCLLKVPLHLNLICMSYDQKMGHESNWEFDFRPQSLSKQRSNEVQLGCVIHCWKEFFEGYKILPSHFQNKLDLRKIWASKVLGQQKSQGKCDIWM